MSMSSFSAELVRSCGRATRRDFLVGDDDTGHYFALFAARVVIALRRDSRGNAIG